MAMVPTVSIRSCGKLMPVIGLGTGTFIYSKGNDKETLKGAYIDAIKIGYRHFDTAFQYPSEQPLGEAIMEALHLGLIQSRDELFITSKLSISYNEKDLVLPAINMSLRNLQLDYLDLYLIHVPIKLSQEAGEWPNIAKDMYSPMNIKEVWEGMEECKNLGLTKAIGVSNFPRTKLEELLSIAKIPPAVNQVEMNPIWQQKQLREFCKEKGIHITAYSPLGAYNDIWGHNKIMKCSVLEEIAKTKGKTIAQIVLRWLYEQGVSTVPKSLNKERMKENLQIFDWCLTEEEVNKINQLPQHKGVYFTKTMGISASNIDFLHQLDAEL